MRTLNVSTEVFAKIWASRQPGEESEDAILRRILGCAPARDQASQLKEPNLHDGFYAAKVGVHFVEGFEIFRTYKGKSYKARATGGHWLLLNDNSTHTSLHKLSWAVVQRQENSWLTWRYRRQTGGDAAIDELRKQRALALTR